MVEVEEVAVEVGEVVQDRVIVVVSTLAFLQVLYLPYGKIEVKSLLLLRMFHFTE